MTELLALMSAVTFGAGDFLGGRASMTASPLRITAIAQVASALVLIPVLMVVPSTAVTFADVVWGAAGGLFGLAGILALYTGLAIGPMGVVAPITAVVSALLPIGVGLLSGEDPGGWALLGMALGLIAVVAITRGDTGSGRITGRVLGLSLIAGAGFAFFFIALAQTEVASGMWPLVGARAVTVPAILAVAWLRGDAVRSGGIPMAAVGAGALDMVANGLFLAAVQRGLLAIASVLAALYPAVTVLLARIVLHERMSPAQLIGVVFALGAIALIGLP